MDSLRSFAGEHHRTKGARRLFLLRTTSVRNVAIRIR